MQTSKCRVEPAVRALRIAQYPRYALGNTIQYTSSALETIPFIITLNF